jgi:ribosomal protein S1
MPPKRNAKDKNSAIKRGKQRDIVYGILLECAAIVRDEFWRRFYEDLAVGKSTKGIYITNGVIQTSNKRNGFVYSITDKAPEVIVAELHHLLTTHTSICSRKDMLKKRQFVRELEDELNEYDRAKWTGIKRKNVKTMLLVDYAIRLNRLHSLTWPATIAAYQTITSAFDNKTHSSRDVEYVGGKILSIEDIELDEESKSIVNTRQSIEEEREAPVQLARSNAIMLQSLFEPYIAAWIKTVQG